MSVRKSVWKFVWSARDEEKRNSDETQRKTAEENACPVGSTGEQLAASVKVTARSAYTGK